MKEKCTIDDIARLAGVSKTTVSRVLNHKPDVGSATRKRILRIVEEQGFVPNITAAGLAGGRSHLIGVLLPSFTSLYVLDIMRGMAEAVDDTLYELVLYSINDRASTKDKGDVIERILTSKLTAGLLAIMPGQLSSYVTRLHKPGFPVMTIDDQEAIPSVPRISADNRGGAYIAVRHLLSLGHSRIAHIKGPAHYLCARERYQGYCQALEEAGLAVEPGLVLEGDFQENSGFQAARRLFSLPSEQQPTAIFAGNDLMAYGVLSAAAEQGIAIPSELAVVGFDDLSSSALVRPALTTVRQPFHEMGRLGVKRLLTQLSTQLYIETSHNGMHGRKFYEREAPAATEHIQLATSLVVRASCGASHQQVNPT
ncbi:LacI family transcriptional regulator [Ktedonosporobacter rubrisoli]|uniref:LacI family transcriptional regulator n=1 Tax=Ktedonosporobacter rubrisoli TaxID=2509675 RepID=A0A4P6JWT3_KTERU|nr:LacI family DNA-binding transcriptional regulator [Ktedonosporobacter rubrisoli]QBD80074.1 LacI family transcriptional regulator [Ktedonosporobacter rubrisoli]